MFFSPCSEMATLPALPCLPSSSDLKDHTECSRGHLYIQASSDNTKVFKINVDVAEDTLTMESTMGRSVFSNLCWALPSFRASGYLQVAELTVCRCITVLSYIGHCEVHIVVVLCRDKRKEDKDVMDLNQMQVNVMAVGHAYNHTALFDMNSTYSSDSKKTQL
uniref:Uncharacterized protein n=1 Tax=Rattus norvegicus TaxID=10116 RepID=Q7TP97_RAT